MADLFCVKFSGSSRSSVLRICALAKPISLIREVPGSAVRTKTPMGYYGKTSLGDLTCPAMRKRIWTKWRCDASPAPVSFDFILERGFEISSA